MVGFCTIIACMIICYTCEFFRKYCFLDFIDVILNVFQYQQVVTPQETTYIIIQRSL